MLLNIAGETFHHLPTAHNHREFQMDEQAVSKSWSIHTRREITSKYQILERVGSGAYAEVYKSRRLSDDLTVALKEVHDYQSAFREIEALQKLQNSPNVVVLHEYFWSEDEDAVLVLEYLNTDLASVVREAKKGKWKEEGLRVGDIKRWMIQMLCGVDECHRNSIVHRDLKPSNLLISADGVLKLADFGQARILLVPGFVSVEGDRQGPPNNEALANPSKTDPDLENTDQEVQVAQGAISNKKGHELPDELGPKDLEEIDKESYFPDVDTSCLATCTASDMEEDPFKSYAYEAEEGQNQGIGPLTSCVGTRWFRAPELLYGSTTYGPEIDLWSLGCIFAELLNLEPLFPGTSDIDQLGRIFSVLGDLSKEVWPGCIELPDYNMISFGKVENPLGLEACLPNRSADEILLVKKLLCYDPTNRATAMELLQDRYFNEEPLPVPNSELRVPAKHCGANEDSPNEWGDYKDLDSDSDFDDFGPTKVTRTDIGYAIQFS